MNIACSANKRFVPIAKQDLVIVWVVARVKFSLVKPTQD